MRTILPVVLAAAALHCTSAKTRSPDAVAPTAAVVPAEREHFGVADSRASLPELICLEAPRSGTVALVIRVQEPVLEGVVVLVDMEGRALGQAQIHSGQTTVELMATVQAGDPGACAQLAATAGISVYSLRWRYR